MSETGLSVRLTQAAPIPLHAQLHCAPGEVLALVGPSGSGKSTLLRAIAGLLDVREGAVSCNGDVWFDAAAGIRLAPRRRRVGIVFQHYALFPHLPALDNVMEACLELPRYAREQRARDWLARVNLAGLEQRRPRQLSGGQQQRVAVARALAREPHVLLLDEPFSAVDRATRERLYQELAELRRDLTMPIILVTHDLDEAAMLADRLCVLSQGRTLQTAEPDLVVARPDSVQVARLVGLKNVFRAQVIAHSSDPAITIIEWRGRRLEARHQPQFAPGATVCWSIPQSNLILHRRNRPSRGERENPVSGTVADMVRLGDNVAVSIYVDGPTKPPLFISIPRHVAQRNAIASGVDITVSLLADGIHLVPSDRQVPRSRRQGR
ncbi:MAG: ABC transporter ATP-binding protein [Gammaproteobacteria bacterium]